MAANERLDMAHSAALFHPLRHQVASHPTTERFSHFPSAGNNVYYKSTTHFSELVLSPKRNLSSVYDVNHQLSNALERLLAVTISVDGTLAP